jgi:hypothetical protein
MSTAGPARGPGWRAWIGKSLPLAVIWVPLVINAAHVVGFTVWTTWLSFDVRSKPRVRMGRVQLPGGGAHRKHRIAYINLVLMA